MRNLGDRILQKNIRGKDNKKHAVARYLSVILDCD
jgi:hypothetical protein